MPSASFCFFNSSVSARTSSIALAEPATYEAVPLDKRIGRGWLVNYYGRAVKSIDRAWDTVLRNLDRPTGREWRPYVLRHSLATLVRNRGGEKWDLEGLMGHRSPSQTETYAIGEFPSVVRALTTLFTEIEKLAAGALHRTVTGAGSPNAPRQETKMSG